MNIEKMKREKQGLIDELKALQSTVQGESRSYSSEENQKFEAHTAKIQELDTNIKRAEYLAKQEESFALRTDPKETKERAKSFGDFIKRVITDPQSLEQRDTTMGTPTQAGYFVPPSFSSIIRAVEPSEAIVKPRATVIPVGEGGYPDNTFYVTAFDQSGNNGVYGGITMTWPGEVGTRQVSGDIQLKQIALTPQPLVGFIDISKQLLENSEAVGVFAETQMRLASIAEEERKFIQGTGNNQPTGFSCHPCNAIVARTTANKVTLDDIINMVSSTTAGGNYVFIASRGLLSQLVSLKDAAGNLIWMSNGNVISNSPGSLFGYPVFFSERFPTLGNQGDIMLVDLSKYLVKEGSPMKIFVDPYTRAINNVSRLYFSYNIDGAPWLTSPIKGEDGVSRSPFVALGASA